MAIPISSRHRNLETNTGLYCTKEGSSFLYETHVGMTVFGRKCRPWLLLFLLLQLLLVPKACESVMHVRWRHYGYNGSRMGIIFSLF
jgi:hypothetical protein